MAFNIQNTSPLSYCTQPQKDIMPPRSRCAIEVTMQLQGKAPGYMHRANELIVWSTKVNDCIAVEDITTNMFINEAVNAVDEVNLDVVFDAQIVLPQPSLIHCKDMPLVLGTIVSKDQVDSTQPQEASAETSENICISNDNLDGVSDDNPPVLHDRHTACEEQKMHVPPSSVSTANAARAPQAVVVIAEHWVQCDICHKWRLLPYESDPATLPKKWKCSMQHWLPGLNRCHVGENETTNALQALYVIPPPANSIPSVGHPHAASSGLATANTFSINGHAEQSRKRKSFPGDGSALVDSSHPTQASAYSTITQPRPRIKSTADNKHYSYERDSVSKSVDVSTEKKKSKSKNRGSYSDGGDLVDRSKKHSKEKDKREMDYGEHKASKKNKEERHRSSRDRNPECDLASGDVPDEAKAFLAKAKSLGEKGDISSLKQKNVSRYDRLEKSKRQG